MNKDKIPTYKVSIKIDEETKEYEFFEYLTQEEADEYSLILKKNQPEKPEMIRDADGKEVESPISTEQFQASRKFFISHLIKDLPYEEYNTMAPKWRDAIWKKVMKERDKKK